MKDAEIRRDQRLLRGARIRHVLGEDEDASAQQRRRDRLLGPMGAASSTPSVAFGEASDELVDMAVSLALVDLPESPDARLSVASMALTVLAADGQFARLRQLSPRLRLLSEQVSRERPYLSATLEAVDDVIAARWDRARARLISALGSSDSPPVPRTREHLGDLLLAVSLREWLIGEGLSTADNARRIALNGGDGLLLVTIDFVRMIAASAESADLRKIVDKPEFAAYGETWRSYIDSIRVRTLFPSQIRAIDSGVLGSDTHVVSLPTSSGKTFIAELRIAAELSRNPDARVLYVAPYRLLARQVERALRRGLRPLNARVADLGGSFDVSIDPVTDDEDSTVGTSNGTARAEPRDEAEAAGLPDVGVLTPERLDGLLRLASSDKSGSSAAKSLFESLALLVFDELQLVGRPGRGPRFELLLTRLLTRYPSLPMLGLAAATHGMDDVAAWLGDDSPVTGGRRPTGTIEVLWQTDGTMVQRFGRDVRKVAEVERGKSAVQDAANLVARMPLDQWPVLVVETTRPWAENVARRMLDSTTGSLEPWRETLSDLQRSAIADVSEEVAWTLGKQHPLVNMVLDGVAYHHAGVPAHLLRRVEDLARARALRYLATTTTVAEGADLPFRTIVIPHLTFQGVTGRIERDLYLNLVGRAGRANVSVEGTVFILDSDARSLKDHVRVSLWGDVQADRVRGLLSNLGITGRSVETVDTMRDVQTHLLAWLGEGGSDIEDQPTRLAERTFTWSSGDAQEREAVRRLFDRNFQYLEGQGLVRAASPYRLTALGDKARLTGLSARSCLRLSRQIVERDAALLDDLVSATSVSPDECLALARLLYDSMELLQQGLWLRRTYKNDDDRVSAVIALEQGTQDWPEDDALYQADLEMLSGWLSGASYTQLGEMAPSFKRGLFSSQDEATRASDAAEALGRLSYPASWCWSGIRVLRGDEALALPAWLSAGLELGVPTQTCVALVRQVGVSRDGAIALQPLVDSSWSSALDQLQGTPVRELAELGLTRRDMSRLSEVHLVS